MVRPGILIVEGVIDGHGDLPGYKHQELDVGLTVSARLRAPDPERPQAPERRREGHNAQGFYAVLAKHLHDLGEASLATDVGDHQRLLSLPYQAPG